MRPTASFLPLLLSVLLMFAPHASAASFVELSQQIPAPPADAGSAKAWISEGRIVAPDFTRLEAALQQEKAARPSPAMTQSGVTNKAPAVAVAVSSYQDYLARNSGEREPALLLRKRTDWIAKRFDGVRKRMGTQAVGDHNAVDDELKAWGGLFRDWQATRTSALERADAAMAALSGHSGLDPAQHQTIMAYRLAMIREIEIELSITRLALERFSSRP